jgi:FlaA1/EpsC-like NDP-sugar epimerase
MSLATSKYNLELGGKMKPLRDFFIVLFFVFFGSRVAGDVTWEVIKVALLFSVFILIGKPLIVMTILRLFGYKKRTNFLAGSSIAQISEFSLILVLLGFSLGHLTQEVLSLVVLIAIFTIGASSYSIYYSHWIFSKISHLLNLFEGSNNVKESSKAKNYEIVLFGYHRIGYKLLDKLRRMHHKVLVVDYNPKVILALGKRGIDSVYGDAADKEFLREINLDKIKMVISTIPDENSNVTIKEELMDTNPGAIFIATAEQPKAAIDLYNKGIDFVLVPHHLGGEYAAHLVEKFNLEKSKYKEIGNRHKKELDSGKEGSNY